MPNKKAENLNINTTLGHYRIVRKLGAGGMGEIYLAEDTRLDRQVALKILPAEFAADTDRMRRFVREAKSASALNHPNIITIYEINESENTRFIATEYIAGETLDQHLRSRDFSLKSILEIAIQIASALQTAHSANIIHRDIKPDNVMIRQDGLVKILDFGIAKLIETRNAEHGMRNEENETLIQSSEDVQHSAFSSQHSTTPGTIIGTANYMSPEQAKGQTVDGRTDIFSFGVVLYEMIAGHLPFQGDTPMEAIGAILHKEPISLEKEIPNEVTEIINQCLRKNREERYQTINDVLGDLRETKQNLELQNLMERTLSPEKEEPKTQILQATTANEIHQQTTDQTVAVNAKKNYLAVGLIALLLIIGGIIGYKYFAPANKQIESIAVMPFVNDSGNQDIEYLSDGMTDTLINSLSKLPDLKVKASEIVFRYKGKEIDPKKLASELNVQAILMGRVRQNGDQIILNLSLIDAQTESTLWGNRYERKQSELIGLQSEIARDLSNNLKAKLSGGEKAKATDMGTTNVEAYEAYLKGDYYARENFLKNYKKVIEQYQLAIDKDPNYARGYAALANTYLALFGSDGEFRTKEDFLQPKALAEKAVSLDPTLAFPHLVLASINEIFWNWNEAEKEYKQAIELEPNDPVSYSRYSDYLKTLRRYDEALTMLKRAQELDPSNPLYVYKVSIIYIYQKNYQASIDNIPKTLELNPNRRVGYILAESYLGLGRREEAIAAAEKSAKKDPENSDTIATLGYFYAAVGKRDKALAMIKELEKKYSPKKAQGLHLATIYAPLGEKDKAFEWLEKDFRDKAPALEIINYQTPYENLRDDPRYKDLLRRMGLPE